jgi:plasmid stabilization system protein ParE
MIVSVHPEAEEELIAGATYYARHATSKVAKDFLDEFDYAVSLLRNFPGLGTPRQGKARRLPLRRFPYSVVYYETADRLRVVAIAHHRRKPGYWRGRA